MYVVPMWILLPFKPNLSVDLVEIPSSLDIITSKTTQRIVRLAHLAFQNTPAWGLGQCPDPAEEKGRGDGGNYGEGFCRVFIEVQRSQHLTECYLTL